jgi:hypothetical protein
MEDFDALAAALGAGIADLRGCLILSRDGLVLGGYPDAAEQELKSSWLRFAEIGEPQRGFVQFGNETWCLVRRGPYGSFAVTGIGVRPGVVIDHMERVLLAAEEARSKGEGTKAAPTPVRPTQRSGVSAKSKRKNRSSLHTDPGPTDPGPTDPGPTDPGSGDPGHGDPETIEEPVVIHAEPTAANAASEAFASDSEADQGPFEGVAELDSAGDPSSGERERPAVGEPSVGPEASTDEDEIDRFSLAAEFSRLLQDDRDDADG